MLVEIDLDNVTIPKGKFEILQAIIQSKAKDLLYLAVEEMNKDSDQNLEEIAAECSKIALSNGMTPKILDDIVNER